MQAMAAARVPLRLQSDMPAGAPTVPGPPTAPAVQEGGSSSSTGPLPLVPVGASPAALLNPAAVAHAAVALRGQVRSRGGVVAPRVAPPPLPSAFQLARDAIASYMPPGAPAAAAGAASSSSGAPQSDMLHIRYVDAAGRRRDYYKPRTQRLTQKERDNLVP